jgi:catechol 2,3-dioxygenase-like lactoylglutathione lyase family enzyme
VDHTVVLVADLEKSAKFYTDVLGLPRIALKTGAARSWMGVGDDGHGWIAGNPHGTWIELAQPSASAAGKAILANRRFGEGMIMELGVEVADLAHFHDTMHAKGIVMTSDGTTSLPAGQKAVTTPATGDSYSYFPVARSEGMRIRVFQRGPKATSVYAARDASSPH